VEVESDLKRKVKVRMQIPAHLPFFYYDHSNNKSQLAIVIVMLTRPSADAESEC
jgi:hypothetical protein